MFYLNTGIVKRYVSPSDEVEGPIIENDSKFVQIKIKHAITYGIVSTWKESTDKQIRWASYYTEEGKFLGKYLIASITVHLCSLCISTFL